MIAGWMRLNVKYIINGITSHRLDSAYFLTFFVTPSDRMSTGNIDFAKKALMRHIKCSVDFTA